MLLPFVEKRSSDLSFASVPKFRGGYPFVMEEQFARGSETYNIVLTKGIELKKHLVVIIAPVHDKSGSAKKGAVGIDGAEGDVINGSKILFFR